MLSVCTTLVIWLVMLQVIYENQQQYVDVVGVYNPIVIWLVMLQAIIENE